MDQSRCPIWDAPLDSAPKNSGQSRLLYSPRAGGVYKLEGNCGASMAHRGEPISELHEIYRSQCQYCVLFVSRAYATKIWPKLERISAQERAMKEKQEYILRFDDTEIPGLPSTVAYIACPAPDVTLRAGRLHTRENRPCGAARVSTSRPGSPVCTSARGR